MLSPLGSALRRHDPDRFLTTLFAPAERREALITLFAFNHELARAREVTSQSLLALIRLQWWREVVEGDAKPGEISTPLFDLVAAGTVQRDTLLGMIDAREAEVDGNFESLQAWRDWLLGGAGGLAVAAGQALGVTDPQMLHGLRLRGAAYGAAGLLRSRFALARQSFAPWPMDLLAEQGLIPEDAAARPTDAALVPVLSALKAEAHAWLKDARLAPPVPRAARAAGLPAVLAARDLKRPLDQAPGPRGFGDRFAVTRAALFGRP
ncbi:squalene/phytoene synthase family protein [Acidisoma silvae]|uniref:Squalene/phytoene synthase family protein n=1 Tax=Acidisoma silvae TaxID=2802396 RepID=A0A963YNJ6_9PROT|nr:squalene/phytoene synthase family protein [Acidisoma silvae]MCB8873953.1 squalene/phytoene synthase family protein [Acidisoma silvae]